MRLVTRRGLIATSLAVAAIAAPTAQAGGLFSTGPDKGAAAWEAQSFLRIDSHSAVTPTLAKPDQAAVARDEASIGAAFVRIAQAMGRNIASTATPPAIVRVTAPSGFDWGAAGIGAAGVFGLAMIVLGLALLVSQRRTRRSRRSAAIAS